jgi:hypothetical protein
MPAASREWGLFSGTAQGIRLLTLGLGNLEKCDPEAAEDI